MPPRPALLRALLAAAALRAAGAAFTLASVFGSRMVLQRDAPNLSVWGRASPGTIVTLSMAPSAGGGNGTSVYSVQADGGGDWAITLGAQPGSLEPFTLVFTTAPDGSSVYLADVLFGDVFLSLGQSNAQIPVSYVLNATEEMAAALQPQYGAIRLFQADRTAWSFSPQAQLQAAPDTVWGPPNAASIAGFSALGWFNARYIADALNYSVPLGVVSLNWGATSIQAWSSPAACAACGGCPPSYNGWVPPGPTHPGNTSVLWNAMYTPWAGPPGSGAVLPIAGATWMQGEDNAQAGQADYYGCALPALVGELRALFGSPAAWVGVVQLGPWVGPTGVNDGAAGVRQAQLVSVAGDPRATTVTAADGGDPYAPQVIHSRLKQLVGRRLAAAALSVVYGRGDLSPAVGPTYASATAATAGSVVTVTVQFAPASVGGGLVLVPPTPGNYSTFCPVDAGVPADVCGFFGVQTSDGAWRNATAAVAPGGGALTLTVDTAPATGLTAVATSSGWALWPVLPLRNRAGLPAFPWRHNVSAAR